ncbi:UPF0158 family protein [Curtobacterium oceanosedimentum]|uniref:UPF0158 family protein n=1 Tax=Curtobacterium oceanosedimentum TaxID=465820 RepID=UPI00137A674F|nr:UPF0158 family protein [Curtobacterium oceanosedimentum]
MHKLERDFSPSAAGFRSFRALLSAAEERGIVATERAANAADVTVRSGMSARRTSREHRAITSVRHDLWKAFLDWRAESNWRLDRTTLLISGEAPGVADERIRIPSVSRDEHVAWMQEFASDQSDHEVRDALIEGLSDADPARGFARVLRQHDASARRWKRFLRERIIDRAVAWAINHDLDPQVVVAGGSDRPASPASNDASRRSDAPVERTDELRHQIMTVLASMPLSELMRLPIPIEYMFRR